MEAAWPHEEAPSLPQDRARWSLSSRAGCPVPRDRDKEVGVSGQPPVCSMFCCDNPRDSDRVDGAAFYRSYLKNYFIWACSAGQIGVLGCQRLLSLPRGESLSQSERGNVISLSP